MIHLVYIVVMIIILNRTGSKIIKLENQLKYKQLQFNELYDYCEILEKQIKILESE